MFDNRFASADLKHGETNALVKLAGGADQVRKILRGELKLVVTDPPPAKVLYGLLELVDDSQQPAERFVAREKFIEDENGELPISSISASFNQYFLDKIEEGVRATTLLQRRLLDYAYSTRILSGLGGGSQAEIGLFHVFEFLKRADRSRWYVFYVRDVRGELRAVSAHIRGYGKYGNWHIDARSISNPLKWDESWHVVSPR